MHRDIQEILANCPVIGAAKDMESLRRCLNTDIQLVFILFGDVCNIGEIVEEAKRRGKLTMVHIDLIGGLAGKEVAVDYIKKMTRADGIISTKTQQIRRARELGLYTVLRFFAIDSRSLENIAAQSAQARPDCIEIMPGIMPRVIRHISRTLNIPLIAGGMLYDKQDVITALQAGAISVSTSKEELWKA